MKKKGRLEEKRHYTQKIGQKWSLRLLRNSGSRVHVTGTENIPEEGPVLIVSNHQSYFDIPLLVSIIPLSMGFVAKRELGRLPVISQWMKLIECSFIDRKDLRQSIKAIQQAQKTLQSGQSMVIFPEGTRSKKREMAAFKPGSLKLAQKAQVPVLPVAIQGTCDIFETRGRIHPAKVEVKILPLLSADEVTASSTSSLLSKVFTSINEALGGSSLLTVD